MERYPAGPTIDMSGENHTRVVGIEVSKEDKTCEFHVKHNVQIVDLYNLHIKEKRAVVDTSCRWANKEPVLNLNGPFGYRAQDSNGDWWRCDWNEFDGTDYWKSELWVKEIGKQHARLEANLFRPYSIRDTY